MGSLTKTVLRIIAMMGRPFERHRNIVFDKRAVKSIGVFALSGIGNLLLATPCLEALKKSMPWARLEVIVVSRGSKAALENNPYIDKVIVYDGHPFRSIFALRRRRYDLVFNTLPSGIINAFLGFVCGARYRVGHVYDAGGSQTTLFHNITVMHRPVHEVERNIDLLSVLGIKVQTKEPRVYLKKDEIKAAENTVNKFNERLLIGMHPGSNSNQTWKRWGIANFVALAQMLRDKYKARVLFFLGPDEMELAPRIKEKMSDADIFTGSFRENAALIGQCSAMVANDSGLGHLAVAVGTPVISIMGPVDPDRIGPYGPKGHHIRHHIPCSPCYDVTRPFKCTNANQMECLKRIAPNHVLKALIDQKMLNCGRGKWL
jgi:ADP-heptose:LPS heptosyltransferase